MQETAPLKIVGQQNVLKYMNKEKQYKTAA
jgi:hypothetical protein